MTYDLMHGMTLKEAQDWLRAHVDKGARCPCCKQLAKVYRRPLPSPSARALIALHREVGTGWAHLPTIVKERMSDVAHQGGYASLGVHWGLIEEDRIERQDGGRAGWWRVTQRGLEFLMDRIRVPKYAHLYDGRCLGLSGRLISISEALGNHFDYDDLMRGDTTDA